MSTKTTFKRIALVTVAALGFGALSTVSATAAATFTDTFSTDKTSITVVTNGTTAAEVTNGAIFKISLGNNGTDEDWTLATGEELSATVVGVPAGNAAVAKALATEKTDLTLSWATMTTDNGNPYGSAVASEAGSGAGAATNLTSGATTQYNNNSSTKLDNSVYLRVVPTASTDDVIDSGTYTVRVRLTSNSGALVVKDTLLKVTYVSSAASSGAVLTVATAGTFSAAETVTAYSATKYIKATITDANGGRVVVEDTAGTTTMPALTVDLVSSLGSLLVGASGNFAAVDDATDSDNGYSTSAAAVTAGTLASIKANGTYGVDVSSADALPATAIGTTNKIRVRYGAATAATAAITILNAAVGTAGAVDVTADNMTIDSASPSWTLPLSSSSAVITTTGTAGSAYSYTVTWTGVATGDQTPKSATPTVVYASAGGVVSFTVKNANPVDGATAVIAFNGWSGTQPTSQTLTWSKTGASLVSVTLDGAYVALKSANKFVATVTDVFGAPVAGVIMQPSIVSGSANYSATAVFASLVTDASGQVSYTLTDAAAVADDTDSVKFTQLVSSGTGVSATSTITYAATAPAATALTAYYNADGSKTAAADIVTANPSVIYTDGAAAKFPVQIARDNSKAVTRANSKDHLAVKINAGVAGVAITATSTTGYVLNGSNLQKSTYTVYSDEDGLAVFTVGANASGKNVVTFTSGTATTSVTFSTKTIADNQRFIALTNSSGEVTAKITDRYGNGVSGAGVQISTSVGTLGNGQKTATYTTDSTGSVTVLPVGSGDTTITAIATGATTDMASLAGYVGTTKVESTLKAGNDTATLVLSLTASATDTAQVAADAAAEATDAANAATDAANAAAEAADAATAAAQDAADAVAALSAQVSSMMSSLKAQLTALTNLVIKIQKKVKA